jgi:formate dehydrogenase maturation protein FdhE
MVTVPTRNDGRSNNGRWTPGTSGNSRGRAVGAKQRLSQSFVQDLFDD